MSIAFRIDGRVAKLSRTKGGEKAIEKETIVMCFTVFVAF